VARDLLVERVEQLIQQGREVLATEKRQAYERRVDAGKMAGFRSAALSFIQRVYGPDHTHYREFDSCTKLYHPSNGERGTAILESIRNEIAGNWLLSIKGLITAEVFADFIEMASHLVDQGYKDAAAVIAGSTLEEHLRQLCQANKIEVEFKTVDTVKPMKADRLNADLASAEVYSKLDQKAVTMWLDLRNKAAHGRYDEYNKEQVVSMISGITEFMARVPV
jgi:hypothetical protein